MCRVAELGANGTRGVEVDIRNDHTRAFGDKQFCRGAADTGCTAGDDGSFSGKSWLAHAFARNLSLDDSARFDLGDICRTRKWCGRGLTRFALRPNRRKEGLQSARQEKP